MAGGYIFLSTSIHQHEREAIEKLKAEIAKREKALKEKEAANPHLSSAPESSGSSSPDKSPKPSKPAGGYSPGKVGSDAFR